MADEPSGSQTPGSQTPGSGVTPAPAPTTDAPATPLPPVPTPNLDIGYTEAGVPTLEGVREKIENRYGTALGATELAEETAEVRTAADQYEARNKAAAEKLEEIRASMHRPD